MIALRREASMDTDQRKSFRILVPDGQEQAVLKFGRRSLTVRMVDSSAGGFAVASPEALNVKRGDVLRLRTSAGWHEVRIVRLESFSDGMLIGLERLREIDDPRQLQGTTSWLDSLFLPSGGEFGGSTAVRLFTVGALAGAILAGFVWLIIHDRQSRAEAKILPPVANQVVDELATKARKVANSIRNDDAPKSPVPAASHGTQP
jgi:hypothetical protein